jgi:Trypsin-like peptidase domain
MTMPLPEIIYKHIPAAMLERVVYDQGVISRTDFTRLFKASGLLPEEIAVRVVQAYGPRAAKLASGLYNQIDRTDWETAKNLYNHFSKCADLQYDNHQASLVGRYPNLNIDGLSEFLNSVKRQVCLIVSRSGNKPAVRGTGFLVAPDLVLTSRHVFADFQPDDAFDGNCSRIEVLFDFFHGDPVDNVPSAAPDAKKLGLNKPWHIASSNAAYPNGKVIALSPDQLAQLPQSLDFILIRLEDRVGLQSIDRGGGRRRGWIPLPQMQAPVPPADEWIVIPQHPNGSAQRIDVGRFLEVDDTGTRLRYNTNTAQGSSGAPCFDHTFNLVGIHNAQVGPGEKAWANEAVWFDKIAPALQEHVQNAVNMDTYALRWSIARDNEKPQVVLGREKLLGWLRDSVNSTPPTLAGRVYAALAYKPAAGCSFSIELLQAEIRNSSIPRAVFGSRGQQLPTSAEDFLLALTRELDITLERESIPARPASVADAKTDVGEIDKVERWLSEELPAWLGRIIIQHIEKQIDGRIAAKQAREYYLQTNQQVPVEIEKNANAPEAFYVRPHAWESAYVVIDNLRESTYAGSGPRTELRSEVLSLVAALVKNKPEAIMHPGLRRLRWMFLGYLPDFLSAEVVAVNGATVETLDPDTVGKAEVVSVFDRMWAALVPKAIGNQHSAGASAGYLLRKADGVSGPDPRLSKIQREMNEFALEALADIGIT